MLVLDEPETHKEYMEELLKDPLLFYRVILDGLDDRIVGESEARKVVFLCAIGSMVLNANRTSYNLMVNSESGAGKDHLVDNILKLFEPKRVCKRTRISPMALTYWHNSLFEPKWTWDSKILYLEDCSNEILNSDVFKVFTSGGSHATIVKDQRAIDIKIVGKPVVIITSASAAPEPELIRRFLVVNLTETEEQTKEIMEKWADHAKRGYIPKKTNKYGTALKFLKPQKVKIPFAKEILQHLPSKQIIMRTQISRFLDFIKASAVLYQFVREKDVEGYIVADGQDYNYAREVMLATSSNSDFVPLTINQKEVIEILKEMGMNIVGEGTQEKEIGWSVPELLTRLPISRAQLYREMNKLTKLGYVKKELYKGEYDNKPYAVYHYKEQIPFTLPTWEKVVSTVSRA